MIIALILTVTEFFGHLHPVLVHLPIGILLLAVVFHFLSYKKKFESLQLAVKYSLLLGMLSAIASCITGFLLSQSGDYDEALADKHQWFGISVAVVSAVAYYFTVKDLSYIKWIMPLMLLLIIITGHLGGTLTHGEGYLTESFSSKDSTGKTYSKPIPNVQQALVYADIIQPILKEKCYSCHGSAKQKGKLRLDDSSFIMKGSEDGKVLIAGDAAESELIKRILLPSDNDDHMPPKEKPQLTKEQTELLNWWVNTGADFHKKVTELNQPDKIKTYLVALQSGSDESISSSDIPEKEVEAAPDSILKKLNALDVSVSPVAKNSNYLTVNFVTVDTVTNQQLQLLKTVSKQITWLKLGNIKINDSVISTVGSCTNLTRLYLNKTNLSDKQLAYLKNLTQLQYLNLASTNISAEGLSSLGTLKNLKRLYIFQTNIKGEQFSSLQKIFPHAAIDTGGYTVQYLQTDTMLVKAPASN